jgi:hypothetical protein
MRTRLVTPAILAVLVLAACGDAVTKDVDSDASSVSPNTDYIGAFPNGGDLLYTCGDTPFDPSLLEGPGGLEHADGALADALRRLPKTPDGAMDGEGWRVVHESENEVLIAAPSPSDKHPYVTATFERSGQGWEPLGWGDCLPIAVLGDRSPATWKLGEEATGDTTELLLLVSEQACSSGRELTEENTRVDVQYSEDEIVIVVSADPLSAGKNEAYTCIGAPPSPITVELEEPVQGRRLVDAGPYPPTTRSD